MVKLVGNVPPGHRGYCGIWRKFILHVSGQFIISLFFRFLFADLVFTFDGRIRFVAIGLDD